MPKSQSLRRQLLSRLTLPLLIVVMIDTSVSYFVALHYSDQAYDSWLLDSAKSLAQQVKFHKDKITFDLPPIATEVFRWDEVDKTFFKVESRSAGFIAGDKTLPSPPGANTANQEPLYSNGVIQGQRVRIVTVSSSTDDAGDVSISVAETLNKRQGMMGEILLALLVPQLLLVLITGLHIWTGINRGLSPLKDLASMIEKRSAKDLQAIPDAGVPLEVRALTHTINALLARLASALSTQQRFVENAAHQLRTPLAGLKIQAERALQADDLHTMKPALAFIKDSADRVAHLSTQLLVLARSESMAQSDGALHPVNLVNLARNCCMSWASAALARNIELAFDTTTENLQVLGDETLLWEMLSNLLDNAIVYANPGGSIGVAIRLDSATVTLSVEDNGPGIDADVADRVFERFYRIPGSPGDGCGLGLAIVKEIADLHSARVGLAKGAHDTGTRIEVMFARA